jgi:hypothetical protein
MAKTITMFGGLGLSASIAVKQRAGTAVDTQAASEIASGIYKASFTGLADGTYLVNLVDSSGDINWADVVVVGSAETGYYSKELNDYSLNDIADSVWDEILTGATHNIAASAGRRLRQASALQQIDATVNDVSSTTTIFVTTLPSSVNNFYNDSMIVFIDGALAGQVRAISHYVGSTKSITVSEALTSAPANGDTFTIISMHIHPVNQIADAILKRNVYNVEATAGQHTLATAVLSMLEWEISGSNLIIKRTDGTTVHYTKVLSSATGTGDVITGLN